jgi:ADP-ribose pyrophosphatase
MELKETKRSSKSLIQGKIVNMRHDQVVLPDGREALREIVEHPGGVCIAAMLEDGRFLMVEQYRYAHQRVFTEYPAGKREPGEDPLSCAMRELEEETGYRAKVMIPMGEFIPSPAYLEEVIYLFFAPELEFVGQHLDDGEFLNVKPIALETLIQATMDGDLMDGKTIALTLKLSHYLQQK